MTARVIAAGLAPRATARYDSPAIGAAGVAVIVGIGMLVVPTTRVAVGGTIVAVGALVGATVGALVGGMLRLSLSTVDVGAGCAQLTSVLPLAIANEYSIERRMNSRRES
ncbi:MAG: hypothetical protein L0Y55_10110, partial [Anaerolineales bacterium]|nr:hypothetical protein [Anaerolineales bacterium]